MSFPRHEAEVVSDQRELRALEVHRISWEASSWTWFYQRSLVCFSLPHGWEHCGDLSWNLELGSWKPQLPWNMSCYMRLISRPGTLRFECLLCHYASPCQNSIELSKLLTGLWPDFLYNKVRSQDPHGWWCGAGLLWCDLKDLLCDRGL